MDRNRERVLIRPRLRFLIKSASIRPLLCGIQARPHRLHRRRRKRQLQLLRHQRHRHQRQRQPLNLKHLRILRDFVVPLWLRPTATMMITWTKANTYNSSADFLGTVSTRRFHWLNYHLPCQTILIVLLDRMGRLTFTVQNLVKAQTVHNRRSWTRFV